MPEAPETNAASGEAEAGITPAATETYEMPGELETVIAQLRTRIQEHRITLSQSRKRTEIALVHPVLNYMDWDVSDPAMVMPEYEGAHYALVWRSEMKALITARTLTETSNYHGDDKIGLCNQKGITNLLITNGDRWMLRNALSPSRKPLQCRISDESLADTAHNLRRIFAAIG